MLDSSSVAMTSRLLLIALIVSIVPLMSAISYRCENDQVLIVQSFGNDTIRMHCQRLNLCGVDNMNCAYSRDQVNCGGKMNFVAHVNQLAATAPVRHTCCELKLPAGQSNVPGHDGNDCFIYELPDGSTTPTAKKGTREGDDDDEVTVLKSVNDIPEQFDNYVGYRMRLFMLKNKSPPTLIVKSIERALTGYRVTICRPRCDKFSREEEPRAEPKATIVPREDEQRATDDDDNETDQSDEAQWSESDRGPVELRWGSWSTSTWESSKEEDGDRANDRSRGRSRSRRPSGDNKDESSKEDRQSVSDDGDDAEKPSSSQTAEPHDSKTSSNKSRSDDDHDNENDDDKTPSNDIKRKRRKQWPSKGDDKTAGRDTDDDEDRNDNTTGLSSSKHRDDNRDSRGRKTSDDSPANDRDDDAENEANGRKDGKQRRPMSSKSRNDKSAERTSNESNAESSKSVGRLRANRHRESGEREAARSEERDLTAVDDGDDETRSKADSRQPADAPSNEEDDKKTLDAAVSSNETSDNGQTADETTTLATVDGAKTTESDDQDSTEGEGDDDADKATGGESTEKTDDDSGDATFEKLPETTTADLASPSAANAESEAAAKSTTDANSSEQSPKGDDANTTEETKADDDDDDQTATNTPTLRRLANLGEGGETAAESGEGDDAATPRRRLSKTGSIGILEPEDGDDDYNEPRPDELGLGGGDQTKNGHEEGGEQPNGGDQPDGDDEERGSGEHFEHSDGGSGEEGSGEGSGEEAPHAAGAPTVQLGSFVQQSASAALPPPPPPPPPAPPSGMLQWEETAAGVPAAPRACFPADALVRTVDGLREMATLQVGDMVLVPAADGALRFERVALFYHREPHTTARFIELTTTSGKQLALTALHLLPLGDCGTMRDDVARGGDALDSWVRRSRFAQRARVGECLLTLDESANVRVEQIVKVGRRFSTGIYSPVTTEGTIVANDVVASCFSQLESHATQKAAFDVLMTVWRALGYLSDAAYEAVHEVPVLLNYFHQFSWVLLPFSKY